MYLLLTVFNCAGSSTRMTPVEGCPEDSIALTTGCYIFPVSSGAKNWLESRDFCTAAGGMLVEVDSPQEQMALAQYVSSQPWRGHVFWIGFSEIETDHVWAWTSGKEVTYTNWWTNEPNHYGSEKHCAQLQCWDCGGLFRWNDVTCSRKSGNYFPICELSADESFMCLVLLC